MNLKRITFEHVLIAAAFLAALALRFSNLGAAPLSDSEASWALQALQFVHGGISSGVPAISPQPAYVVLTGILFSLFGSSDFLARFWPALAGSLLVFLPILVSRPGRRDPARSFILMGRGPAIIMAFGLALTPGLVIVSRQAGGPMMAVSFLLLALGLFVTRRDASLPRLALTGVFAGLALLSGVAVISGLVILLIGWFALAIINRFTAVESQSSEADNPASSKEDPETTPAETAKRSSSWIPLIISTVFTILLVGSAFLRFPQGLAAWLETIPAYLQGWLTPSGIPVARMLLMLVIYQPVAVLFGLFGASRGLFFAHQDGGRQMTLLSLVWIAAGLVVILAYPARLPHDLAWVIVPFWALAATEISRSVLPDRNELPEGKIHPIAIIQALLLIVLMSLLWYSLASISRLQPGDESRMAHFIVIIGILALGALTTVLIQLGWSWSIARLGLAWGIFVGLALFSISMLWGAAYVRPNQPQELWAPAPATGEADLFTGTLQDISSWNTGRPDSIDIVSTVSSPSVQWILRDFAQVRYIDRTDLPGGAAAELPSILITHQAQETPALAASYRGQDFILSIGPGWSGALPPDLIGWLTFRKAPLQQDMIIVWARSDLFPGGILSQPPAEEPLPETEIQPDSNKQEQP